VKSGRHVEIDLVKGFAILGVLLIHSKALGDSWVATDIVDRSVQIFLVIFGLNSRLWWRSREIPGDLATWYKTRAQRILVPYWATLVVWWALVLWLRPADLSFHWWLPLAHALGWTLGIGTGWFVTVILQLIVVFPGIESIVRRFGAAIVLGVLMALEIPLALWLAGHADANYVRATAFLLHVFVIVVFGMLLATRIDRLAPMVIVASAALWALCALVHHGVFLPRASEYAGALIDLPLAILLLGALRALPHVPVVTPALAWLGVSSWGLYLGQLLVHNAVVFRCGVAAELTADLAACHFPFAADASGLSIDRWLYTLVLLLGALAFVWLGGQMLRLNAALRRAGAPLPDLAN
jgi:peptidoglycan/LPS O-acetylase OafA/YrhL